MATITRIISRPQPAQWIWINHNLREMMQRSEPVDCFGVLANWQAILG